MEPSKTPTVPSRLPPINPGNTNLVVNNQEASPSHFEGFRSPNSNEQSVYEHRYYQYDDDDDAPREGLRSGRTYRRTGPWRINTPGESCDVEDDPFFLRVSQSTQSRFGLPPLNKDTNHPQPRSRSLYEIPYQRTVSRPQSRDSTQAKFGSMRQKTEKWDGEFDPEAIKYFRSLTPVEIELKPPPDTGDLSPLSDTEADLSSIYCPSVVRRPRSLTPFPDPDLYLEDSYQVLEDSRKYSEDSSKYSKDSSKDSEVTSKNSKESSKYSKDSSKDSKDSSKYSKDSRKDSQDSSKVSEASSKDSEESSKVSEDSSKYSKDSSKDSKDSSKDSKDSSKYSKDSSKDSQDSSKVSKDSSKVSEDSSKYSKDSSKYSKDSSKYSKASSKDSKDSSKYSKDSSKDSKDSSKYSKDSRKDSQDSSKVSKDSNKVSEVSSKDSKDSSKVLEDSSKYSEDSSKDSEVSDEDVQDQVDGSNTKDQCIQDSGQDSGHPVDEVTDQVLEVTDHNLYNPDHDLEESKQTKDLEQYGNNPGETLESLKEQLEDPKSLSGYTSKIKSFFRSKLEAYSTVKTQASEAEAQVTADDPEKEANISDDLQRNEKPSETELALERELQTAWTNYEHEQKGYFKTMERVRNEQEQANHWRLEALQYRMSYIMLDAELEEKMEEDRDYGSPH